MESLLLQMLLYRHDTYQKCLSKKNVFPLMLSELSIAIKYD